MWNLKINYEEEDFNKLVEAGRFDFVYINPNFKFRSVKGPKEVKIEALHFNRYMTTREVLEEVKNRGFRMATFEEALTLAKEYPGLQKKNDYVTIYEQDGALWVLILHRGGGGRRLGVDRCRLDGGWGEYFRFLVVASNSEAKTLSSLETLPDFIMIGKVKYVREK